MRTRLIEISDEPLPADTPAGESLTVGNATYRIAFELRREHLREGLYRRTLSLYPIIVP